MEEEEEEEEEGKVTLVSESIRKEVGISAYDFHYKTYLCCYCTDPIALSMETSKIMIDERVMVWLRVHKIIPRVEEDRIINDVKERECGTQIHHRSQYIHSRCLTIVLDPSNKKILELIQERAKITLPTSSNAVIYTIPRYMAYLNLPCIVGDGQLDEWSPGIRYRLNNDITTERFMHLRCYHNLKHREEKYVEKVNRKVITDYYDPPEIPTHWTLSLIEEKSEAWHNLLGRFIQPERNIVLFRQFIQSIEASNLTLAPEEAELRSGAFMRILFETNEETRLSDASSVTEKKKLLKNLDDVLNDYPRVSPENIARLTNFYNRLLFIIYVETGSISYK